MTSFHRLSQVALAATLASCARSESSPPGDSTAAAPAVVSAPSADSTPPASGCRKEGLWTWCSIEDRMQAAGVILTREDAPPASDLFKGDGRAYKVGAGDDALHVYVYPTSEARRGDTDALDSATVSPKGTTRAYKVMPLLVTSHNLAALVFTLNERTSERLANALSAGLPQPKR